MILIIFIVHSKNKKQSKIVTFKNKTKMLYWINDWNGEKIKWNQKKQ